MQHTKSTTTKEAPFGCLRPWWRVLRGVTRRACRGGRRLRRLPRVAPEHPCARGLRRRVGRRSGGWLPVTPSTLGWPTTHMFVLAGVNIVHNLNVRVVGAAGSGAGGEDEGIDIEGIINTLAAILLGHRPVTVRDTGRLARHGAEAAVQMFIAKISLLFHCSGHLQIANLHESSIR